MWSDTSQLHTTAPLSGSTSWTTWLQMDALGGPPTAVRSTPSLAWMVTITKCPFGNNSTSCWSAGPPTVFTVRTSVPSSRRSSTPPSIIVPTFPFGSSVEKTVNWGSPHHKGTPWRS